MQKMFGFFFGDLIDLDQHVRISGGLGDLAIPDQTVFDDQFTVGFPALVLVDVAVFIDQFTNQSQIVDVEETLAHEVFSECDCLRTKSVSSVAPMTTPMTAEAMMIF
jgi:hypothetical protein